MKAQLLKYQKDNPESMKNSMVRKPTSSLLFRKSRNIQKCNAPRPSIPRRRVNSRENLSLSSSGAKQCAALDMSESNINKEKMRKLTQVMMEAEKTEVHPESVALQKKITGHSFKAQLKRKLQKKILPGDSALGKSEKLMNCQSIEEEHVHPPSIKKRRLMKKYLQTSPDKVDSGIDLPLAEEDVDKKDCIPLQQQMSLEIKDAGNSTREAHDEGHTTSQQKLTLENKITESDAGNGINELQRKLIDLQRKCAKRRKKLIQTQKGQTEELQRVWEEKILEAKNDHRLETALTRVIHGKGREIMDKLKILDDKLAKKVAEINLLKDSNLKDLEAEQLAARNEECKKSATWMSNAKGCISSQPTKPLGTGDNMFANLPTSGEGVLLGELQSLDLHGDVQAELGIMDNANPIDMSTEAPFEGLGEGGDVQAELGIMDNANPIDMSTEAPIEGHGEWGDVQSELGIVDNANPIDMITEAPIEGLGEGGAFDLPNDEQFTQPKHFGNGERVFENQPNANPIDMSTEAPIEGLGEGSDVQAELGIVDNANPIEMSTEAHIEGLGEGVVFDLPNAEQFTQPKHFGIGARVFENQPDSGKRVPGEMQSLELHGDVSAELSETVANEIVDSANPVDMITDAPIEGSGNGDAIDLPDAEQLTQPKHFGSGQRIFANLPDSGERDPGEIQSPELIKDIPAELAETVINEIVIVANPMELSTNTSIQKGFGEGDAFDLPDALLNKRYETDGTTIDDLDLAGQVLKTSEQTKASPHPPLLLPLRVQDVQDLMSAKIRDYGIQVVGKVNSSPEIVVSEHVDAATNFLSNLELKDPEEHANLSQISSRPEVATTEIIDTVIAEKSTIKLQNQDASVIQDQGTLQIEVANTERIDTAALIAASEIVGTAKALQSNIELQDQVEPVKGTQSMSRIEVVPSVNIDNRIPVRSSTELQDEDALIAENHVGLEIEVSNSGVADSTTPVQVESHIDAPAIENCEQLRLVTIDASPSFNQLLFSEHESQNHNPSGASETEMPLQESTSQSSHETSAETSASFQNNVATERVESTFEIPHQDILQLDVVSHSHCQASWNTPSLFADTFQKEMERNYKEIDELQKSHEDRVSLLKSEYQKEMREIQNKYSLKLLDAQTQLVLKRNGLEQTQKKIMMNKLLTDAINHNCSMLHGSPFNPMQFQPIVRPAEATAQPPTLNQQNASIFGQISVPQYTRLGLAPSQNFLARHIQHFQQAAAANPFVINGAIPRPQGINAVHHPTSHSRFGGMNICSSAPHFQATIPASASSSMTSDMSALRSLQYQQHTTPLAAAPQCLSSTQNRRHHPTLSALGLVTNTEHHRPPLPGNPTSSLPAFNSSFGCQQSCFDALGNVQRNQFFSASPSNAICLSDDE